MFMSPVLGARRVVSIGAQASFGLCFIAPWLAGGLVSRSAA